MTSTIEVTVPDIGDFSDVEVIEVLVASGDAVDAEQSIITLESDKATMDVPSASAGRVVEVHVAVGDKVSQGSPILSLEPVPSPGEAPRAGADEPASGPRTQISSEPTGAGRAELHAEVVVLGSGPGGYTAAFRAADLGKRTVLVERYSSLGGVCLNVGCIPSKALLHTAELINGAKLMAEHGVEFGTPRIDLHKLGAWKDQVVGKLTKGLAGLARQRKVQTVHGVGRFVSPNRLRVDTADGSVTIAFDHAIIAAGSQASSIPVFPNDDPRIMDSTDALQLETVPDRLLVIGGGIIGLEMATVYHALGSRVTVVELLDGLLPGCDRDIVKPLHRRVAKQYEHIYLETRVSTIEARDDGLRVTFNGSNAPADATFDKILVAVGRRPNGHQIGADAAGVAVDEAGFIAADREQRTNVPHIFAIGDITGQPMLAHKATHEGKVAAEVAAGQKSSFDALAIPSVAYTDPEVAWTGLTETEAKSRGVDYETATFPWAASGRSLGMGRDEGLTKVLFERDGGRLVGAAVVGPHAGDLIAEATLALEMGADASDIGLTIHPHPTLSETLAFAAEMVEGTVTDLYVPKSKR